MFTNFNLTSKMEFCRCHGVLTEKLNGCSSPRKQSRCDASLRSCASGLETCEGAEPRDGAGGQRARWRAALPRSGPTRPATSNCCTPRGGAHPAPCARGAHGIFFRSGTALSPAGILQTSPLKNHLPRYLFVVLPIYYLPSSPRRSTVPPRRPIVCPPTAMPTVALPAADGRGIIICAVHIGRAVPAVPACVGRDRAAPPPTVTSPVALPHLLAVALPQFSDECIRSLVFRYLPLVVPISSLYCSV